MGPITPRVLTDAMAKGGDVAKCSFEAMMEMQKIDVARIEAARAARHEPSSGNVGIGGSAESPLRDERSCYTPLKTRGGCDAADMVARPVLGGLCDMAILRRIDAAANVGLPLPGRSDGSDRRKA
jgi:hypothetical protein